LAKFKIPGAKEQHIRILGPPKSGNFHVFAGLFKEFIFTITTQKQSRLPKKYCIEGWNASSPSRCLSSMIP